MSFFGTKHGKSLLTRDRQQSVTPTDLALVTAASEKSMQDQLSILDAKEIEAALRGEAQTRYPE